MLANVLTLEIISMIMMISMKILQLFVNQNELISCKYRVYIMKYKYNEIYNVMTSKLLKIY